MCARCNPPQLTLGALGAVVPEQKPRRRGDGALSYMRQSRRHRLEIYDASKITHRRARARTIGDPAPTLARSSRLTCENVLQRASEVSLRTGEGICAPENRMIAATPADQRTQSQGQRLSGMWRTPATRFTG